MVIEEMKVLIWLLAFIVVCFGIEISITVMMLCTFKDINSNKSDTEPKQNLDNVQEKQRNVVPYSHITINPTKMSDDTLASVKEQVYYITNSINYDNSSFKILVMVSAFDRVSSHLESILTTLSRTDCVIHVMEDTECTDLSFFIHMRMPKVRVDKIFRYTDNILIKDLGSYDVIITAHSGIRSTYELIHGIVRELAHKEES